MLNTLKKSFPLLGTLLLLLFFVLPAQAASSIITPMAFQDDSEKTKSIINEAYDIARESQAMIERFPTLTFSDVTTSFIRKYSFSIIQVPDNSNAEYPSSLLFPSLIGEEDVSSLKLTFLRLHTPLKNPRISSHFGWRWGRPHQGTDFSAPTGTPIYAAESGTVTHSGWSGGYGYLITLDHGDGIHTNYGHCSRLLVRAGQYVTRGQLIGHVGSTGQSTGPHLHFEVLAHGVHLDPELYLAQQGSLASR